MDPARKRDCILTAVLLTVTVLSLRFEATAASVAGIIGLLGLSVWSRRTVPVAALGGALVFLYAGPQAGWIYRRGSHVGVNTVQQILASGWPLSALDAGRGFSETPLVHFHAIVTSLTTGLGLQPRVQPRILVTWLLPLWFTTLVLFVCGVTVRRYKRTHSLSTDLPEVGLLLVPVVLWIPLYSAKTGFTRQSIAITLFTLSVYLLFRLYEYPSYRLVGLAVMVLLTVVVAHHLTSFALGILTAVVVAVTILGRVDRARGWWPIGVRSVPSGPLLLVLYATVVLLFLAWQLVFTDGGRFFARLLASIGVSAGKLDRVLAFILGRGVQPDLGLPLVERGLFIRFQSFFSRWIYQMFVAVGCLLLAAGLYRRDVLADDWTAVGVLMGGIIGFGAALSWLLGVGSVQRIMTFFVLVGGWLAPAGVAMATRRVGRSRTDLTTVFVVVIAVVGLCMIPPYVLGAGEPRYEQGETDQRFPAQYYAGGEFVDRYVEERTRVLGDENAEHVLVATAGRLAISLPDPVLNGTMPPNSVLLLLDYNTELFFGFHVSTGRYAISPTDVGRRLAARQSRIYINGRTSIYQ